MVEEFRFHRVLYRGRHGPLAKRRAGLSLVDAGVPQIACLRAWVCHALGNARVAERYFRRFAACAPESNTTVLVTKQPRRVHSKLADAWFAVGRTAGGPCTLPGCGTHEGRPLQWRGWVAIYTKLHQRRFSFETTGRCALVYFAERALGVAGHCLCTRLRVFAHPVALDVRSPREESRGDVHRRRQDAMVLGTRKVPVPTCTRRTAQSEEHQRRIGTCAWHQNSVRGCISARLRLRVDDLSWSRQHR